jgi:hypothetical protein
MKKTNLAQWISVLIFLMLTAAARGQSTITFVNYGSGWAAPWYGLTEADPSSNCVVHGANSGNFVTADNTGLAGTGWTAQLWAGIDGGWEWEVVPVGQTTFRTGSDAGLLASVNPLPVAFALPGQRIIYQLRVWDNKGGTIHSWDEVINNPSARRGATPIYRSPPLTSGTTTLEFVESFVLVPEFAAPAPVLSLSRDGCSQHTGFFPGIPAPDVHEGEDVTLSVVCPNPATTVQWSLNGTNVPGATELTLLRPRIQSSQSGLYAAVVTAPIGARTARMTNSLQVSVLPAPRLAQARLHPTLGFSAAVEGVTNRMIQIEYSDDLRSWTPGPLQDISYAWGCGCLHNTVTIPPPLPVGARFYRARLLP